MRLTDSWLVGHPLDMALPVELAGWMPLTHPRDADAVQAECRPDFEQIYDAYAPFVWRCVRRLGVAESAVEDAVQDVFLAVHRRLDDFEGRSAVRTWLYGFAVRVARNYRRSARRRRPERPSHEPARLSEQLTTPARQLEQLEVVRRLYRLLDELSPQQREVFVLAELEGLSGPEIAELLGANLNGVYSRLRAARRQFNRGVARLRAHDEWRGR